MIVRPLVPGTGPNRLRRAFTLLEVLVVVAILLILASVGTIAAVNYLANAKVSEAKLKMSSVANAVKTYQLSNNGDLPDSLNVLIAPTEGKPLLEGGQTAITDPWGNPFQLKQVADQVSGSPRVVIFTTSPDGKYIQMPDK